MILPKIALRNLSRQKRRSILLGSALSFGMLVLVVTNGLAGGLMVSLQRNFSDMIAGHIFLVQVEKDPSGRIISLTRNDAPLFEALEKSGLEQSAVYRRTAILGEAIYSGESAMRQITGVNWAEETKLDTSLSYLAGSAEGMAETDGIIISNILAENIGLIPKSKLTYAQTALLRRDIKMKIRNEGSKLDTDAELKKEVKRIEDELEQKQQEAAPLAIGEPILVKMETIFGQQNVAEFTVRGIYKTQMDISAYVDREKLNQYVEMPIGSYNLCGIELSDFSNLDNKTVALHSLLKDDYDLLSYDKIRGQESRTVISNLKNDGFEGQKTIITNLNNELGMFVTVLQAVQAGSFGLFIVILLVVMVGLVNTFRIVIYERTKEIGTMRALGTQRSQVRNLFILEALFLGVGGSLPGAVLGVVILNVLKFASFDSITELAFFLNDGHLSYTLGAPMLVTSFLLVVIFTLIAALVPARKASRLEPAQALRTQF